MMYLALTYDHRLLDGREAVTFLVKVSQISFFTSSPSIYLFSSIHLFSAYSLPLFLVESSGDETRIGSK